MEQVFIYLLKVNCLLIFFWMFYKIFLKKETYYKLNRFYFIAITLLSFILPLIYITKIEEILVPASTNFSSKLNNEIIINNSSEVVDIKWYENLNGLLILLSLITLISVINIVRRFIKINKIICSIKDLKNHPTEKNILICENEKNIYSFYKWIVLPKELLNEPNLHVLILHEKIHLIQKHTYDLVFMSLISDLLWFNPIIKLIRKDINLNLEYIVDAEVIKQENSYLYQKTLINYNQKQPLNTLTNAFNSSDLKKRILQLNSKKSNTMKKMKFLLITPFLIAFFGLFQIQTIAQVLTYKLDVEAFVEYDDPSKNSESQITEVRKESNEFGKNVKEFNIDSNYDDNYYSEMKKNLNNVYNLDVEISDLKRNSKGELTSIKFTWDNGTKVYMAVGRNNKIAFEPCKLYVYEQGNTYNIKFTSNDSKYTVKPIIIKNNKLTPATDQNIVDNYNDNKPIYTYKTESKNNSSVENIVIEKQEGSKRLNNGVVIILNGQKVYNQEISKINPNDIESISVIKNKNELKKYGDDVNDALIVKLKNNVSIKADTIIIDERQKELVEFHKIKKNTIESQSRLIEERKKELAENNKNRKKIIEERKKALIEAQKEALIDLEKSKKELKESLVKAEKQREKANIEREKAKKMIQNII